MEHTIKTASDTLILLYEQRSYIEKSLHQQETIKKIYEASKNIVRSMNDSIYRVFFFKNKIEDIDEEKVRLLDNHDKTDDYVNNLEQLKKINLLIGEELELHNKLLKKSIELSTGGLGKVA